MRSTEQLVRSLVGMLTPLFCVVDLETSNSCHSCRRACDAKQTAYRTWCRARNADHWGRFVLAFRTPVLLRLHLDLNTYGGVDPLCVFPIFLKMGVDIIAPKLGIIFIRSMIVSLELAVR